VALAALAEAAEAAWGGDTDGYDARAAGAHVFGDPSGEAGVWMDRLGDVDVEMRRIGGRRAEGEPPVPLRNSSVLFNDLFTPIAPPPDGDEKLRRGTLGVPLGLWRGAAERLADLAGRRPRGVSELMGRELDHTLEVARVAVERGIWRREGAGTGRGRELAARIGGLIEEHRRLWLERCREGGLEDSCGYYRRIAEEMER
jgi:hypothetical protein